MAKHATYTHEEHVENMQAEFEGVCRNYRI